MTRPGDAGPTPSGVRSAATRWRRRIQAWLGIAGPLAIVAVMAYLLVSRGPQILDAVRHGSPAQFALVCVLALITLVARTEAVVSCLNAMGARPRRSDIHAANALTFLASQINHYFAALLRGWLLQRLDRERAPTIPQMVMVDTSTTLIEGTVVLILVIVTAGVLNLPWWVPTLMSIAGLSLVGLALWVRRRFGHRDIFRGLDVLYHSHERLVVAGLMVIVIALQVTRTYLALRAVGLHPSPLQAVAVFVASGILSSLFAGPSAGNAGGPLLVFGHSHLAASAAAGLSLSVTGFAAGVVYAIIGTPLFVTRLRAATLAARA